MKWAEQTTLRILVGDSPLFLYVSVMKPLSYLSVLRCRESVASLWVRRRGRGRADHYWCSFVCLLVTFASEIFDLFVPVFEASPKTKNPNFLLQCFWNMHAQSFQSCPTLQPMDCSLPGSSVHGILQVRILEWVFMPSSRGTSQPRDWIHVPYTSFIAGRFLTAEPLGKPILESSLIKLSIFVFYSVVPTDYFIPFTPTGNIPKASSQTPWMHWFLRTQYDSWEYNIATYYVIMESC